MAFLHQISNSFPSVTGKRIEREIKVMCVLQYDFHCDLIHIGKPREIKRQLDRMYISKRCYFRNAKTSLGHLPHDFIITAAARDGIKEPGIAFR